MATIIKGDLLSIEVDVIVQQCNCLTVYGKRLAAVISTALGVDLYKSRRRVGRKNLAVEEDRGIPGKCILVKNATKYPAKYPAKYVACLLAQFAQGKPGIYNKDIVKHHGYKDNAVERILWFMEALIYLEKQIKENNFKTVAFPKLIGCNMAGGDWNAYLHMINQFAKYCEDYGTKVYIVDPVLF
jgi:O-acetyl-ADP-ribose deacetylase (regulator of RNase III)